MLIGFFSVYINPYKKDGDLKNPIKFAVNVLVVTLAIILANDPQYFVKNMIETMTYVSCLIFFEDYCNSSPNIYNIAKWIVCKIRR